MWQHESDGCSSEGMSNLVVWSDRVGAPCTSCSVGKLETDGWPRQTVKPSAKHGGHQNSEKGVQDLS